MYRAGDVACLSAGRAGPVRVGRVRGGDAVVAIKDIPVNLEISGEVIYLYVDRIGYPMALDEFMEISKNGLSDKRILLYNAAINAGLSGARTQTEVLSALKAKTLKG